MGKMYLGQLFTTLFGGDPASADVDAAADEPLPPLEPGAWAAWASAAPALPADGHTTRPVPADQPAPTPA